MALAVTAHHVSATPRVAAIRSAYVCPAPTVATYRRSRLVVLLAALATALLLVLAASRAAAAFRDVPASVSGRRPAPAQASATQRGAAPGYVVQPGETLWSIARRLQPEGDIRPLVHQLVVVNGGTHLEVGQRLALP